MLLDINIQLIDVINKIINFYEPRKKDDINLRIIDFVEELLGKDRNENYYNFILPLRKGIQKELNFENEEFLKKQNYDKYDYECLCIIIIAFVGGILLKDIPTNQEEIEKFIKTVLFSINCSTTKEIFEKNISFLFCNNYYYMNKKEKLDVDIYKNLKEFLGNNTFEICIYHFEEFRKEYEPM